LPADDWPADATALRATIERTPESVKLALARFDFRAGAVAVWEIVEQANRYVEATEPWHLARAERAGDVAAGQRLDRVLGALVAACQALAAEIWPFLPDLAARVAAASGDLGGRLPKPQPVFPRIERAAPAASGTVGRKYPAVAGGARHSLHSESGRQKVSEVALAGQPLANVITGEY
jgi:methionyl-tRNA synthetase